MPIQTPTSKYNQRFYRQKHGCTMGSPVSPNVANFYMEEVESRKLAAFPGLCLTPQERQRSQHWGLPETYSTCSSTLTTLWNTSWELSEPHITRLTVPTRTEGKTKENKYVKTALKTCGYPKWAYVKSTKRSRNNIPTTPWQHRKRRGRNTTTLSFRMWQGCQRNSEEFSLSMTSQFTSNLQHSETETGSPQRKNSQTQTQQCCLCSRGQWGMDRLLYRGEQTTSPQTCGSTPESQLLRPGLSSPPRLKGEGHSFEGENVLDREDGRFERGVKEAIYVKLEQPSLNRGGASDISCLTHSMEFWNLSLGNVTTIHTLAHEKPANHMMTRRSYAHVGWSWVAQIGGEALYPLSTTLVKKNPPQA